MTGPDTNEKGPRSPRFTVLLFDDNDDDRVLLKTRLQMRFPDILVRDELSPSGFEALIEAGGFHLVITDYDLGWTNGLAILRQIQLRWPKVPVIICSGTIAPHLRPVLLEAGAAEFVHKSAVDFEELFNAVEAVRRRTSTL